MIKKLLAEFLGTTVLVVFGCGSAVTANTLVSEVGFTGSALAFSTLLIAFAFGLSIVAMAYTIGNVSGCHINPAVSLSMLIAKRMEVKEFFLYIIAQFAGGIAGGAILSALFKNFSALGANGYGSGSALGIGVFRAIAVEIILTAVFTFVVLYVTSKKEHANIAGIVIALTLTLVHILGIPFTGTSVNPARSFGPALFQGGEALSQVWVFIAAPLVGAALAAVAYRFFIAGGAKENK